MLLYKWPNVVPQINWALTLELRSSWEGQVLGSLTFCPVAPLVAHQHPHPISLLHNSIHLYSMVVASQEWAEPKFSHVVQEESHRAMGPTLPFFLTPLWDARWSGAQCSADWSGLPAACGYGILPQSFYLWESCHNASAKAWEFPGSYCGWHVPFTARGSTVVSVSHGATLLSLCHSSALSEWAEAPSSSWCWVLRSSADANRREKCLPFTNRGQHPKQSQQPVLSHLTEPGWSWFR